MQPESGRAPCGSGARMKRNIAPGELPLSRGLFYRLSGQISPQNGP